MGKNDMTCTDIRASHKKKILNYQIALFLTIYNAYNINLLCHPYPQVGCLPIHILKVMFYLQT